MWATYSEAATRLGNNITRWAAQGSVLADIVPLTATWPLARADVMLVIANGFVGLVALGSFIMSREGRQPIKFPKLQTAYNVLQVVLCAYMSVTAASLAYANGYSVLPCVPFNVEHPPMGSVLWLFYVSKILDFMDTFFIVLGQKWKQLSFLHVYHHWSIYQIYWLNLMVGYDGDIYLTIVLNATIHTVMYSYYLCSAQKGNMFGLFAKTVKPFITSMQLMQFFTMLAQALYLMYSGCKTFPANLTKFYFYYIITMVVLFGHFFVTSYLTKPTQKGTNTLKKAE